MSTQSLAGSTSSNTETVGEVQPEATELPLDTVFELLSNERRRQVLRYLLTESDITTLGDLAEHIASIENEKPVSNLTSTERKRVYICLYQCHLPKMDDAGAIDFEEDRKTVQIGDHIEQVTRFLPEDSEVGRTERSSVMLTTLTSFIDTIGRQLQNGLKPLGIR